MLTRQDLRKYTKGNGIEIGAYHNPFPVVCEQVTYIDKKSYEDLIKMRDADPNLPKGISIAPVDVIDNGETLQKIADESQDFVVSSHQLEHCYSPLTAIYNHLRVLKPGGHLIYAVPDMRFTFDKGRELLEYEELSAIHLNCVREDENNKKYTQLKKFELFAKYFREVDHVTALDQLIEKSDLAVTNNDDVHFHVWDNEALYEMFYSFCAPDSEQIVLFEHAGHENFVVLKKL